MNDINLKIKQKAAQSIQCGHLIWIHETTWCEKLLEYFDEIQKTSIFGKHDNCLKTIESPVRHGAKFEFHRDMIFVAGRWALVSTDRPSVALELVTLQWQNNNFMTAWLWSHKFLSEANDSTPQESQSAQLWLIESIMQRLRPDVMFLGGDDWHSSLSTFPSRVCLSPKHPFSGFALKNFELLEVSPQDWASFSPAGEAREKLAWIKKKTDREEKFELRPALKEKPLLLRILLQLSPVRKKSKAPRQKSVHPIDRYKKPFITW